MHKPDYFMHKPDCFLQKASSKVSLLKNKSTTFDEHGNFFWRKKNAMFRSSCLHLLR
jgi:hypothetical protein